MVHDRVALGSREPASGDEPGIAMEKVSPLELPRHVFDLAPVQMSREATVEAPSTGEELLQRRHLVRRDRRFYVECDRSYRFR